MTNWLVTGGAGYIGAHVVSAMHRAGERVVVLDDLSTGYRNRLGNVPLVVGSVLDEALVARTMREHGVTGVVHIAGKKQVGESVAEPLRYYRENVEGLRRLLDVAVSAGVESFLFSSSAAVYGMPDVDLVTEQTDCRPLSPYGETKLAGEWLIRDVAAATGLRYANLRYFNVAGAGRPDLADIGVFNLVPMVFQRLEARSAPRIFGADYDTPDGTCLRDFIHVSDIASAHLAAARALSASEIDALTVNVGRSEGISVREMVNTIRRVTGTAEEPWSRPVIEDRRPGDPARVVASAATISDTLGWSAQHSVEDMVRSAWDGWLQRRPMPVSGSGVTVAV